MLLYVIIIGKNIWSSNFRKCCSSSKKRAQLVDYILLFIHYSFRRLILSDPVFLFGFLFQNADVLKKYKSTTLVNLYLQTKYKNGFQLYF